MCETQSRFVDDNVCFLIHVKALSKLFPQVLYNDCLLLSTTLDWSRLQCNGKNQVTSES